MKGESPTGHFPEYGSSSGHDASESLKGMISRLQNLVTLTVDGAAEQVISELSVLRATLKAAASAKSPNERERRLEHAKALVESLIETNRSVRRNIAARQLMDSVPGRTQNHRGYSHE